MLGKEVALFESIRVLFERSDPLNFALLRKQSCPLSTHGYAIINQQCSPKHNDQGFWVSSWSLFALFFQPFFCSHEFPDPNRYILKQIGRCE